MNCQSPAILAEKLRLVKTSRKAGEDIKRSNKFLIYLVAMLVSIVMLVPIVKCFVALFLDVARLQSEVSSFKKTLTEQTPIIMRHLQQNSRSI